MRFLVILGTAALLAACAESPVVQQSTVDTRFDPTRADTMVAVKFGNNAAGPDSGQVSSLRSIVEVGRRAQRDEFVVVSDGSGGALLLKLYGTNRITTQPALLANKSVVSTGGDRPGLLALFHRRIYFKERIECYAGRGVRFAGRLVEYGRVRSRSLTRLTT